MPFRGLLLCSVIFLTALLAPAGALAGAWPREAGGWFVATGFEADRDRNGWASLYVEYGLRPRLTFVLDAGLPLEREHGEKAVAVLRYDLTPEAATKVALSFGGGLADGGWALRPGVAIGRGFDSRWGSGWAEADLRALWWPERNEIAWKTDVTIGLNRPNGGAFMLQLQATAWPRDEIELRAVPGLVRRIGPVRVELGLIVPVRGGRGTRLKLGTWMEF